MPQFPARFQRRRACRALAQFRRAHRPGRPDMIVLHYTGMQFAHEAHPPAVRPEGPRLVALFRARRRPHRPTRAGEPARLACRRVGLGRRNRHQFALDRHRDRQSRPRFRLSGFSDAADRGGDRAVPRHPDPQHRSGRSTSLAHSDVAPCRKHDPGEKFPWKRLAQSGVGLWVEPAPISERRRCSSPATPARRSPSCRRLLAEYGYGIEVTRPLRRRTTRGRHRLPAPFPPGAGRRHRRRHRRCRRCGSSDRPRSRRAEARAEACAPHPTAIWPAS